MTYLRWRQEANDTTSEHSSKFCPSGGNIHNQVMTTAAEVYAAQKGLRAPVVKGRDAQPLSELIEAVLICGACSDVFRHSGSELYGFCLKGCRLPAVFKVFTILACIISALHQHVFQNREARSQQKDCVGKPLTSNCS